MANKPITLKRNNSGTIDNLYPTTEWNQIESKPSTFTPTSHEHDIDEINGLIESNSFSGTYSPIFYIGVDNRLFTKSGGITFTGSTNTLAVAGDVTVGGNSVATLASPALTGTPTAPTAAANTNTTQIATTAFVQGEITDLIGGAPGALDTLNELAAAINDDSSFASTVTTNLAGKLNLTGGTLTGTLTTRAINTQNYNITGVGALQFNDPGPNEGIDWSGGNFKIYESPDDLTTNSAGNLQFVSGGSRRLTVKNSGVVDVPGTLTAGAATIDGNTVLHRTNRDDTYEFHDASDLAVGWYTIATNTGDRAIAKFGLRDTDSSRHQSVIFYAAHHYGNDDSNTITVLHNSRFGTSPFRYIRIKDGGTYDGAALQVYIDDAQNNVRALKLGDNFQSSGWVLKDWIADATDPGDLSSYSNFTEKGKIDLDNIDQGGIATTGNIYAGGNTTQYRVLTTNDSVNADTLDSINSTSFLRSDADDNYNGILSLGSTSTIKLPNSAQYGIRSSDGYRVMDSVDATLRIGDTGKHSLITLHGQDGDDFKVYYGATHYQIWHEGNDGINSGLDADKLRGYLPAESASANSIAKRDGNGDLKASKFIDGANTDYYVDPASTSILYNIDVQNTTTTRGDLIVDANNNAEKLYISRYGSTSSEFTSVSRGDLITEFHTKNDEETSTVRFKFENTDTETGGGADANNRNIDLISDANNARILVDGSVVWHSGNDGANSSLDADLLDGQHGSYYLDYNNLTNVPSSGGSYTHPSHPGDDIDIDTGALTGATVISDLDFNITSDTEGHITDANATISTRNLTASDIGAAAASHTHGSYDNSGTLTGANVYSQVAVTDGIVTGLTSRTLTASDIGAAASSHSHGNLSSTGGWVGSPTGIGSGDYIVIADSSNSSKLALSTTQFGTSTTTYLRNDGTFANPVSSNTVIGGPGYSPSAGDTLYYTSGAGWATTERFDWQEIKSGSTAIDLSSGSTGDSNSAVSVTVGANIDDTSIIAFEINTASLTSTTTEVKIVKLENSDSVYAGVSYNAYISNTLIRHGAVRVYRGLNNTTLNFRYANYHTNGSSSEVDDQIYIGKIWLLNGVTGA